MTTIASQTNPDKWGPVRFLLGSWKGMGDDGSTVSHHYEFVLQDKFIRSQTRSVAVPESGDLSGEIHEDVGYFSFDPDRNTIVFRQFLSEGFVNTYILDPQNASSDSLVLTSESCEGAGDMRARLIIKAYSNDEYRMILELASSGKAFVPCQDLTMIRVTG
jgi:hypothetical protein